MWLYIYCVSGVLFLFGSSRSDTFPDRRQKPQDMFYINFFDDVGPEETEYNAPNFILNTDQRSEDSMSKTHKDESPTVMYNQLENKHHNIDHFEDFGKELKYVENDTTSKEDSLFSLIYLKYITDMIELLVGSMFSNTSQSTSPRQCAVPPFYEFDSIDPSKKSKIKRNVLNPEKQLAVTKMKVDTTNTTDSTEDYTDMPLLGLKGLLQSGSSKNESEVLDVKSSSTSAAVTNISTTSSVVTDISTTSSDITNTSSAIDTKGEKEVSTNKSDESTIPSSTLTVSTDGIKEATSNKHMKSLLHDQVPEGTNVARDTVLRENNDFGQFRPKHYFSARKVDQSEEEDDLNSNTGGSLLSVAGTTLIIVVLAVAGAAIANVIRKQYLNRPHPGNQPNQQSAMA